MEPHKDASAPGPRDPLLLPDDTPYIEGHHTDGTPWRMMKPADPAPRPAPPRPKDVAELREWIVWRQSRLLECDPGVLRVWPDSVGDLLNAARALGLAPPPMPFPVEFNDQQQGLANIDALLRWLADTSGQPETKTADVNGQPDGDGEDKGIGFPGTEAPTFNSGRAEQMTKVFISYAHSSPQHKQTVSNLVGTLRENGLAVMVDTDVTTPQGPEEGWPKWMKREIIEADWVLVFFDELYRRRFDGEEEPDTGLGATWEGAIITHHFYRNSTKNKKFIPLLTDGASTAFIPDELFGYTRYFIPNQAVELANRLRPSLSDSAGEHSEGHRGAGGGAARGSAGKHV